MCNGSFEKKHQHPGERPTPQAEHDANGGPVLFK